ncbi:MAG: alpha-L-fucosidase [Halioglobus sp.]|nr:alpha-L-fucosidase [Halioglobus sp.]
MRETRRLVRPTSLLLFLTLLLGACSDNLEPQLLERTRDTPEWYDAAKLGIFIHWGPASVPAFAAGKPLQPGELEEMLLHDGQRQDLPYAEWYLYGMRQPDSPTARHHRAVYGDAPYRDFGPVFERRVNADWDPAAWAELFARSGARYVVLVTKHHDGYTLWPSAVQNPHRQDWGSQRDMVGELARAVRARGMRFGTYYSTGLDWSFRLVAEGDLVRDMMRSAPAGQDYADYTHAHMVELIDRYRPDVLWADIGYPSKGRLGELFTYYYDAVPEGAVNDRWGGVDKLGGLARIPGAVPVMKALARWLTANADPLADDPARIGFKTAEYDSLDGIVPYKWESTRGLGASFAYNAAETAQDMLSGDELVSYLVDTVAKNGNLLINVGPDSFGMIPAIQQVPLLGLGDWLAVNGEAIYGTRPWRRYKNQGGRELRYTRSDEALYAIVYGEVGAAFTVENPGLEWRDLEVLGAQVESVEEEGGMLHLALDRSLPGPAAVLRFSL